MTPLLPEPDIVVDHDAYWHAVSAGHQGRALEIAERVHTVSTEALVNLISETQRRVGQEWAANLMSVPMEHRITEISERVLEVAAVSLPAGSLSPLTVACAEREFHALPGRLATLVLRDAGHPVEFLGPDLSPTTLHRHLTTTRPVGLVLSATLTSALPRVQQQVSAAHDAAVPVLVGGSAFDRAGRRARAVGAEGQAPLLTDLPGLAAGLAGRRRSLSSPTSSPEHSAEAARLLDDTRAIVTALVRDTDLEFGRLDDVFQPGHWRIVLVNFLPYVVGSVAGAVCTDDATVLAETRDWLTDVLHHRGAPRGTVDVVWERLRLRLRDFPTAALMLSR